MFVDPGHPRAQWFKARKTGDDSFPNVDEFDEFDFAPGCGHVAELDLEAEAAAAPKRHFPGDGHAAAAPAAARLVAPLGPAVARGRHAGMCEVPRLRKLDKRIGKRYGCSRPRADPLQPYFANAPSQIHWFTA